MAANRRRIYLDYMASTPCDPNVVAVVVDCLTGEQGNPSSPHWAGEAAARAVEESRNQISEAIGCFAGEFAFTSGATESNNIALLGAARVLASAKNRIVTFATEHKAVLAPCEHLGKNGFEVVVCPVHSDGRADLALTAREITSDTAVVSVQLANNEIGTIQPVREIAQLAHAQGALVHVDAAQALGKLPVDVDDLDVDLMSFSAHKLYGPKGVGGLYVRGGLEGGILEPVAFGGGQEGSLRPGTENAPGIAGFGEAVRLCMSEMGTEAAAITTMRNLFEEILLNELPGVRINGALGNRLPGCSSLTIPGVDAEALIANLRDIALSSSSACTSGTPEPSHVLSAIGLNAADSYCTIRIGIGRFTTCSEIESAAEQIVGVARRIL